MQNRAHMESFETRLARFKDNPPNEVIVTLLNSIDNHFNNELKLTINDSLNPQTALLFLGIHAVALTISHGIFGQDGVNVKRKLNK
jgi:hypothetical protein